jgi:two-component system sensor histidine kinase VicK
MDLDRLPVGVVAVDAEKRVTALNARAAELLKADGAVGRPCKDALPAALAISLEAALRDGGAVRRLPPVAVPGAARPCDVTLGAAEGGVVLVLSEAAPAEEELPQGDLKDRFAAKLGHDLKTPLTSIKAYTEALQGLVAEESQELQFLKVIEEESDRLIRMIDEVVAKARGKK